MTSVRAGSSGEAHEGVPPPDDPRWLTVAFHEAGHAVAGEVLGWPVVEVTLEPPAEGYGVAGCRFRELSMVDQVRASLDGEMLLRCAQIAMAGPLAEMRVSGTELDRKGWATDIRQVRARLQGMIRWGHTSATLDDLVSQSNAATREFLDAWWPAVIALAHELRDARRVSGERVREIVAANGETPIAR